MDIFFFLGIFFYKYASAGRLSFWGGEEAAGSEKFTKSALFPHNFQKLDISFLKFSTNTFRSV